MADETDPLDTRTVTQTGRRGSAVAPLALRVLASADGDQVDRFHALDRPVLRLGRKVDEGELRVADPALSRAHVAFFPDPGRGTCTLEDLGSRNGTFLEGLRVRREPVQCGDLVRVGDTLLVLTRLDLDRVGWRPDPASGMVGGSRGLKDTLGQAATAAPTGVEVLLLGETGVGKELVARYVHARSGVSGPFLAVNCATLGRQLAASELFGHRRGAFSGADHAHPGLFAAAADGTLFLDEVGELEKGVQAQLLRAVAEREVRPVGGLRPVPVRTRVVAATNADPSAEVHRFRPDLYARLAQWEIRVPPLRERVEDVPALVEHLLSLHSADASFRPSVGFLEALCLHHWPHNVRGLATLLLRIVLERPGGGRLDVGALPQEIAARLGRRGAEAAGPAAGPLPPGERPSRSELEILLRHYEGRVARVARQLGRERMQVYRWLKRYGLEADSFRT